jgi:hypothetical protein
MRAIAHVWPEEVFVQQPAAQLRSFHLCTLLDKLKSPEARNSQGDKALEHGWPRYVLLMQIETACARSGSASDERLAAQSELTREAERPSRFCLFRALPNMHRSAMSNRRFAPPHHAFPVRTGCWFRIRGPVTQSRSRRRRVFHRFAFLPYEAALPHRGRNSRPYHSNLILGRVNFFYPSAIAE